jgi:hypothetical protein
MENMTKDFWGMSFELPDTFGDKGKEWTEGRAVVWKALQMQAKIDPPTKFEGQYPNYGWWIGLADLLSFAGGVDDIAEYLRAWGAAGYKASTPLQRFIRDNWGESVAVLEIYLYLYPNSRERIFRYVNHCRGLRIDEAVELSPGDELIRLNAASYANAALRLDRDKELAKALFAGQELSDVDYLAKARPMSGDSSHLSPHFAFDWVEHSEDIEDGETLEFRNRGSALLSLVTYSGWYAKLHTLRREFERDPETAGDFNRVEVEIAGLGSIGVFVFDLSRQCFVLEGEQKTQAELSSSPRYGFPLTDEMTAKLLPLLDAHDSWEDEPIELVELHVRHEVDLAHSMTYQISSDDGEDGDWTRIDGEWREGFMIPDGAHHKRCSTELIHGHHLDPTLPWHQAVLDDSYVYDVSPWAIASITSLWDAGVPVRAFFGELAGRKEDDDVSFDSVSQKLQDQIEAYVDSLGKFIPPDSDFLIEDLLEWRQGLFLTAKGMLEAIVEAESHR